MGAAARNEASVTAVGLLALIAQSENWVTLSAQTVLSVVLLLAERAR